MAIQNTQLPVTSGNGCACCSAPGSGEDMPTAAPEGHTNTQSFAVTGMTCGHCAGAVMAELKALTGVDDVRVDLVPGGTSTVTVTVVGLAQVGEADVAAALQEAGDYELAQS